MVSEEEEEEKTRTLFSFEGTGSTFRREENPVTIARRSHLFPSRTQKLSSLALMILGGRLPGKVGRCRFSTFRREENPVTIARRSHLFPSRTQKLSSLALMILGGRLPGKVGRCRFFRPYGQAVKTPPFHGGNPGSIPGRVTRLKPGLLL